MSCFHTLPYNREYSFFKQDDHTTSPHNFGMDKATMHGYWDENNPVKTDNANLLATVYTNENKALLVIANWTDLPQKAKISIDEKALGFHPATICIVRFNRVVFIPIAMHGCFIHSERIPQLPEWDRITAPG